MKFKYKLFVPLVLSLSLLFGTVAFAAPGYVITNQDVLNQEIISNWNSMSSTNKETIIAEVFPFIKDQLGIYTRSLGSFDYQTVANKYEDLKRSGRLGIFAINPETHEYYDTFWDLLAVEVFERGDMLIVGKNAIDTIDQVAEITASEELAENSSVLNPIEDYNVMSSVYGSKECANAVTSLIAVYSETYRYVSILKNNNNNISLLFIDSKTSIYRNGLAGNIHLANNSGDQKGSGRVVTVNQRGEIVSQYDTVNINSMNFTVGTSNNIMIINGYGDFYSLAANPTGFIFPLWWIGFPHANYPTYIYTSYNAWLNSGDDFEPTFSFGDQFQNVPSLTIDSHDLSNIYYSIVNNWTNINNNNNYTWNNIGGDTTITYPPVYNPTNPNPAPGDGTIDFTDITSLIRSIGNFLGSIVNSIATGLANLLSSIVSIVRNITNVFNNNPIYEFIHSFLAWLPDPFDSILYSLFALSVLFGILRLVKGAFS